MLSLRGFRVSLGERCVLRDLSFDIGVNGAYLLLADEGGAKRLLVRALCGPRPATMQCSGSARYLGRQLVPGNAPATPQSGAALMMMSVCDYLISNLPDRDLLPRPAQRSRARTLLAKAGLPELEARFDEPLIQLDTRARRALEIVRTAAPRPALLILDEPLAGVEPAERPLLLELLRMQSRQRAVLLLAQHADLLLALAPKTGRLSNGEVRASALLPRETEQSTLPEIESDPTDRNNAADPGTEGPELAAAAMPGAEPT